MDLKKKPKITDNQQLTQLTVQRLQKKKKNQKTKITRLESLAKQLKAEVKKQEKKYAREKQEKEDMQQRMTKIERLLTETFEEVRTAKEETAVFQQKLKEAEEDNENLKNQLAAAKRPRSVIAKELLNGFVKLLNAEFGAGEDSLLGNAMREGTGALLFRS